MIQSSQCMGGNYTIKPQMQFQNLVAKPDVATALKYFNNFHLSRSCNNPMFPASCLTHIQACCCWLYLLFKTINNKNDKTEVSVCQNCITNSFNVLTSRITAQIVKVNPRHCSKINRHICAEAVQTGSHSKRANNGQNKSMF